MWDYGTFFDETGRVGALAWIGREAAAFRTRMDELSYFFLFPFGDLAWTGIRRCRPRVGKADKDRGIPPWILLIFSCSKNPKSLPLIHPYSTTASSYLPYNSYRPTELKSNLGYFTEFKNPTRVTSSSSVKPEPYRYAHFEFQIKEISHLSHAQICPKFFPRIVIAELNPISKPHS